MKPFDDIQGKYGCILADLPWVFRNRTGKIAPEHKRLHRYSTMTLEDIRALPVGDLSAEKSHLWLGTTGPATHPAASSPLRGDESRWKTFHDKE